MPSDQRREWKDAEKDELAAMGVAGAPGGDNRLAGLAISGGGIRSATFALGVLESLKASGLLQTVHYLSTVSGGGYVGAWLSANCRRRRGWLRPDADWTDSIRHLRRYSNYLSPTVGFFSADTWSMVTIWLRNTLLIQATVILAIACALLLPRPLFELFRQWPSAGDLRWVTIALFVLGIVGIAGNEWQLTARQGVRLLKAKAWGAGLALAVACVGLAWFYGSRIGFDPFDHGEEAVRYGAAVPIAALLVLAGFSLQPVAVRIVAAFSSQPPAQVNYSQGWVQVAVVAPLMFAALLVTSVLWAQATGGADVKPLRATEYSVLVTTAWRFWPFHLSVVFVSFWLLSFFAIASRREPKRLLIAAAAPALAVLTLHAMLAAIVVLFQTWNQTSGGIWRAFVWGPPLVAVAFVLSIIVLIGMLGRESTDGVREWWSRLGAWLGIYATGWMVIAVSALYGPQGVEWVFQNYTWTAVSGAAGWMATVAGGLLAGNSASTGGKSTSPLTKAKEALAAVAPLLFIAGLLIGVSYVLHVVIRANGGSDWWTADNTAAHDVSVPLLMFVACAAGMLLLATRVDINEFSLNAFYRNRLVRCYLGATRDATARNPQNFTGFDEADDVPLAYEPGQALSTPLHIVNCALNLGGSSDLALHTRHSAAFTLTPLHCGSAYQSRDQQGGERELGYVPTRSFGHRLGGPTLGQAISVSGAAASPNMGYHTSPVTAFLLTLFNVRLGWWFPNPATAGTGFLSPHFSLSYLLAELFGGASDKSSFVMVSDGGHFENLAAYELVRRRCAVIVISDGECDESYTFGGLGTLIRMCEVDFGCRITINVDEIRPRRLRGETGRSHRRWAIGRIEYGNGVPDGVLIYLKASMTGQEDTSVLQYKSSHPLFPHESTGDQFYGEDQFESYRRLGHDIGAEVFAPLKDAPDLYSAAAMLVVAAHDAEAASLATS
jgi:hypothetical protein